MRLRPRLATTAVLLLLATPRPCAAGSPYELEPAREWTLAGVGAALAAGGLLLAVNAEPLSSDDLARLDTGDINAFDRGGMEPYREDHAGDVLSAVSYLLPLTFLTRSDTKRDLEILGAMWAEATLINIGLNSVVKAAVLRTRPYAYDPGAPIEEKTSRRARFSFYSGHTTSAAMNCFFVAGVLSEYLDDPGTEAVIWTGAVLYPALTGFLRVDSGHHFRTDVLTGYVIGAAIGYFVPRLHRDESGGVSLDPASVQGGIGVGLALAF